MEIKVTILEKVISEYQVNASSNLYASDSSLYGEVKRGYI